MSLPLAIEMAGGTSGQDIKNAVLRAIGDFRISGSAIDFGAGTGALLAHLAALGCFDDLTGVDYLERPQGMAAHISWLAKDLNEWQPDIEPVDLVVCSEVIEHLENPRHVVRTIKRLLRPGGTLVLTMPNNESIRSILSLLYYGHFVAFRDSCYPAHITALLRKDMNRIFAENALQLLETRYTNQGGVPSMPNITWQGLTGGFLKGRLYSDNVVYICKSI